MADPRLIVRACALSLLAASSLRAQGVEVGGSLGLVKTGMVHSNIPVAQMKALGMKPSLQPSAGAFLTVNLSPMFALQPEVLYAPRGGQWEALGATVKTQLSYVELPLLAKVSFPLRGTSVKPSVLAGPAIAFRSGCSVTGQVATFSAEMTCSAATGGLVSFRSMDAGLVLAAGLDVPFGRLRGVVQARADIGMVNVAQDAAGGELKNRAFGAFVGLAVPLHAPAVASRAR